MSYLIPANSCPWLDFPGVGGVTVWTMSFCERVRRSSPLHSRSLLSSLWPTQNAISQSNWHLRSIAAFWSFSSLTRSLTSLWRRNNQIMAMHLKMLYIRTQGHVFCLCQPWKLYCAYPSLNRKFLYRFSRTRYSSQSQTIFRILL